jgi:pimeloyl-ACP methyl ester carboxylesterase
LRWSTTSRRSWDEEARLQTVEQARANMAAQWPFHFWEMGDAYSRFMQSDETVYAPDVLAHFAAQGYGDFEWLDHLRWIRKPMLVIVGRSDRTCTLARSEEIHREVEGSDLVVIEKAAHISHVEQPKAYMDAVRRWLIAQGVLPDPSATPD